MSLRILVAEDNLDFSEYIVDIIKENFDATIDIAEDGLEALSLALDNVYDLIVSDIDMPKFSGTEVIKKLKSADSINKSCQIIFISGKIDEHSATASEHGLLLVSKPVEANSLISKIKLGISLSKQEKRAG